jgi:hypothetical protein
MDFDRKTHFEANFAYMENDFLYPSNSPADLGVPIGCEHPGPLVSLTVLTPPSSQCPRPCRQWISRPCLSTSPLPSPLPHSATSRLRCCPTTVNCHRCHRADSAGAAEVTPLPTTPPFPDLSALTRSLCPPTARPPAHRRKASRSTKKFKKFKKSQATGIPTTGLGTHVIGPPRQPRAMAHLPPTPLVTGKRRTRRRAFLTKDSKNSCKVTNDEPTSSTNYGSGPVPASYSSWAFFMKPLEQSSNSPILPNEPTMLRTVGTSYVNISVYHRSTGYGPRSRNGYPRRVYKCHQAYSTT